MEMQRQLQMQLMPKMLQMQIMQIALEQREVACFAVCICAAVLTTTGNTLVNWLDSLLYHYYTFALIFGDAIYRFVVGMINAVIMAALAMPLAALLRKQFHYML